MNSLKNHLLISVPHMNDDIFGRSVIYICEHTLEGAMGLIINKPMDDISFKDLKNVNKINSDRFQNLRMELYFGGPILVEKIIALHTNELKIETAIPLNNKISISSGKEIIRNIENDINLDYKLFCGHSGWSPGQLEKEIENGDWLLQSPKTDLLFNLAAEKIWENVTESLGINIIDISNMSGSA
tara:strand:+ start:120 stop:674 length:555 start_codon:yes stop_codon:yes gene_type:complete